MSEKKIGLERLREPFAAHQINLSQSLTKRTARRAIARNAEAITACQQRT